MSRKWVWIGITLLVLMAAWSIYDKANEHDTGQFKISPALKSDLRFHRARMRKKYPDMPAEEFERRTRVYEQRRIEDAKFHHRQRQQQQEAWMKLREKSAGWEGW